MGDRDLVSQATAGRTPTSKGWIRANCPLCEGRTGRADRKASFGLHAPTGRYHCFRCGCSGRLPKHQRDYDPVEADEFEEEGEQPTVDAPEGYVALGTEPGRSALSLSAAREYLSGRHVSDKLVRDLGLGGVVSGRYAGRVIVPVLGQDGAWLWWVGRAWGPAERPYIYPRGARGSLLFNQAALLKKTGDPVYVVEGVFDAMALWPDAVSVLGKPNELHIEALSAAQRPLAIVLDGDAWQEGMSVAARLRLRGCVAGSVRLAPREDPDEVPRDWLEERARDACAQGES